MLKSTWFLLEMGKIHPRYYFSSHAIIQYFLTLQKGQSLLSLPRSHSSCLSLSLQGQGWLQTSAPGSPESGPGPWSQSSLAQWEICSTGHICLCVPTDAVLNSKCIFHFMTSNIASVEISSHKFPDRCGQWTTCRVSGDISRNLPS